MTGAHVGETGEQDPVEIPAMFEPRSDAGCLTTFRRTRDRRGAEGGDGRQQIPGGRSGAARAFRLDLSTYVVSSQLGAGAAAAAFGQVVQEAQRWALGTRS